jgi:hypothetical protein
MSTTRMLSGSLEPSVSTLIWTVPHLKCLSNEGDQGAKNVGHDEHGQAHRVAARTRTAEMGTGPETDLSRGLQASGCCLLRLVA